MYAESILKNLSIQTGKDIKRLDLKKQYLINREKFFFTTLSFKNKIFENIRTRR